MLNAGALTFQEFMMREPLPLAMLHEAVLDFLRDRDDVVLFGAQAVNAYVSEPRMTQDIDVLSTRAMALSDELREYLSQRFHIAVRVREILAGRGYKIYQMQKTGNRHLIAVRPVAELPSAQRIERVLVLTHVELIARKVIAYHQRRGTPKSGTDWRDLALLLLRFPEFKQESGAVSERLHAAAADAEVINLWRELVKQEMSAETEDEEF